MPLRKAVQRHTSNDQQTTSASDIPITQQMKGIIRTFGMDLCQYYNFVALIEADRDIDIYIDTTEYHPNSNLKIYFQSEPDEIHRCYSYLQDNHHKYDYILCYDNTRLPDCKNVIVRLCGSTWIKDLTMNEKQYKISNLCGWKRWTASQTQRIELYHAQMKFKQWPITFFRSSCGDILPDIDNNPFIQQSLESKIDLFRDFQFSIVIENTRERNCFSEKLIDCVITKTIPIYYGCSNIGEHFDITGWIILDSPNIVNDLLDKLTILDETYYSKYIDVINANVEKAKYHGNFFNGCLDALTKIPGIRRK